MSEEKMGTLLHELSVATSFKLTGAMLDVYYLNLKDIHEPIIEWALQTAIKISDRWPSVGTIRKIAKDYRHGLDPNLKKIDNRVKCSFEEATVIYKDVWDSLHPDTRAMFESVFRKNKKIKK